MISPDGFVSASFAAAQIGGSGACIVVVQPSPAPSPLESKLCIGKHRTPTQPWLPASSLPTGVLALHCITLINVTT